MHAVFAERIYISSYSGWKALPLFEVDFPYAIPSLLSDTRSPHQSKAASGSGAEMGKDDLSLRDCRREFFEPLYSL